MDDEGLRLLNAAPAGFFSFRDDGRVVAANDPLLELVGHAREELLGVHVERILGVAGRIFFQTHLFPLVRLHGVAEEIYVELRSKGGERLPVLLNARRDDDGITHCVVMRVRERKKYEDELLRAKKAAEAAHRQAVSANEAKSHYLRSVSHEIRTPINALLGYAELLELGAGKPLGEKELGYVGRVRQAARHLLTLVNEILDLAKIESGAMTVAKKPATLRAALDATMGLVGPQATLQGIEIVPRAREDGCPYVGDHERVVQILVNLTSNAVKFTRRGGRVELECDPVAAGAPVPEREVPGGPEPPGEGPWLRVRVADTGIGIPEDRLDDIFRPFSQVMDSDALQGTGLGLAISRELARLMGGDLTVRSRPGSGSTFSLWLPTG